MKKIVLSVDGKEGGEVDLNDRVFNCDVSDGSIYYAIRNELANKRVGTACTKTRAEIKGSTAKPWAQKGTGRARSGDNKSPVKRGGGAAFGPRPRDYGYGIPKKMKRCAIKSILSKKNKEENLSVVDDFSVNSGKTRDIVNIMKNIVSPIRTVLIIKNDDRMTKRAASNVPWLTCLTFNKLRAHDLFYGKKIVVLKSAAEEMNKFFE